MKRRRRSERKGLPQKILDTLVVYAKTQLLLILAVTVITWGLLLFLEVRFAFLLALITGTLSVIPILGITIAAIFASVVAVFDTVRFIPNLPEAVEGLVVLLLYVLLNIVVDYVLSPYITGKITNIHPLYLLFFVVLCAWAFGILGAFFAVPAVLIGKTVLEHYRKS